MTTTHQLMAAAFCLCGLLFLLHVDSVNSLRCKNCTFGDTYCNSGNAPERECQPNQVCYAIRFFSPGESDQTVTLRGCTANDEGNHCVDVDETWKECHLYCYTENCNSASNIGEE